MICGAGNGQGVTAVCTCMESSSGFGSRPVIWTRELLVSVPTALGVPTTVTVAVAPLGIGPRSQLTPCASSVHEPWLGVAESTLALNVSPSDTWTSIAEPGPRLVTVRVYVTGTPTSVGSGESVCEIARSSAEDRKRVHASPAVRVVRDLIARNASAALAGRPRHGRGRQQGLDRVGVADELGMAREGQGDDAHDVGSRHAGAAEVARSR